MDFVGAGIEVVYWTERRCCDVILVLFVGNRVFRILAKIIYRELIY